MIVDLFFYLFSFLLLSGATGVVLLKNPVHSALSLIFAFLNAAGLLLFLYNEFLAMILIIVYVGAVATLFLFVIMTLKTEPRKPLNYFYSLSCMSLAFFTFSFVLYKGDLGYFSGEIVKEIPLKTLALSLYVDYADYLQIMGFLLLLAMVGCIVLVEQIRNQSATFIKYQSMDEQVARRVEDCVTLVPKRKSNG